MLSHSDFPLIPFKAMRSFPWPFFFSCQLALQWPIVLMWCLHNVQFTRPPRIVCRRTHINGLATHQLGLSRFWFRHRARRLVGRNTAAQDQQSVVDTDRQLVYVARHLRVLVRHPPISKNLTHFKRRRNTQSLQAAMGRGCELRHCHHEYHFAIELVAACFRALLSPISTNKYPMSWHLLR